MIRIACSSYIFFKFLLIAIILSSSFCRAQVFREKIDGRLDIQASVNGIYADKNGLIWIITQYGLYRYDGAIIKSYDFRNCSVLGSMRLYRIDEMYPETNSNYFFIDANHDLYRINDQSEVVREKLMPEYMLFRNTFYLSLLVANPQQYIKMLPDFDRISNIWVTKNNKLLYIKNNALFLHSQGQSRLVLKNIKQAAYDKYGNILIAVTRKKILALDMSSLKSIPANIYGDITIPSLNAKDISLFSGYPNRTPLLWYDKKVFEIVPGLKGLKATLLSESSDETPPDLVYYDKTKQLMLQYFINSGIHEYVYCQHSIVNAMPYSKPGEYYYTVQRYPTGLLSATASGIFTVNIQTQRIRFILKSDILGFYNFVDSKQRIWYQDGVNYKIHYIDPSSGHQVTMFGPHPGGLSAVLETANKDTMIFCTTESIWMCATNSLEAATSLIYRNQNSKNDQEVRCALLYKPDTLWVGKANGMLYINLRTGVPAEVKALKGAEVRTFYRLNDSTILIGTYNKGIICYKAGNFIYLNTLGSIPLQSANGFIHGKKGTLWVSSNNGLFKLKVDDILPINTKRPQTINIARFTNFVPPASNEFNGSSGVSVAALSDSCFAFANANGIVLINPLTFQAPELPHHILFDGIPNDTIRGRSGATIKIKPVVPYYGNRDNLVIHYRLKSGGIWERLSENGEMIFTGLSPGMHRLQFRISSAATLADSRRIQELIIILSPKWYQTTFFAVVTGNLVIAMLLATFWLRGWYLRKKNRDLKKLVDTKTGEVQQMVKQLNETVLVLKKSEEELKESNDLKEEYYSLLSHDLKSPLKFLKLSIGTLKDNFKRYDPESIYKHLHVFYKTAKEIYGLVDIFLVWVRSNDRMLKPSAILVPISPLLHDIGSLYDTVHLQDRSLSIIAKETLTLYTDKYLLHTVIRNAVDNAFKHALATQVIINASAGGGGDLYITIYNNGKMIPEERLDSLNKMEQYKLADTFDIKYSLGFQAIAILTRKLNGTYSVSSKSGQGTMLTFIFPPLKSEH